MPITLSELKHALENSPLKRKYRVPGKPANRLSLGIATKHYKRSESAEQSGFMVHLDLEEPVLGSDNQRIDVDKLRDYLESSNQSSLKLNEIESLCVGQETQYQLLEFIIGPVNPGNARTRQAKLELINEVNKKIKFASFYLDRDEDIMYLYQLPMRSKDIDGEDGKISSQTLDRLLNAITSTLDEIYKMGQKAFSNDESRSSPQNENFEVSSNEPPMSPEERLEFTENLLGSLGEEGRVKLAKLIQSATGQTVNDPENIADFARVISVDVVVDDIPADRYKKGILKFISQAGISLSNEKAMSDEDRLSFTKKVLDVISAEDREKIATFLEAKSGHRFHDPNDVADFARFIAVDVVVDDLSAEDYQKALLQIFAKAEVEIN